MFKNQLMTTLAMWSGPRNISTALMRAWENRPATMVHDEPFYAHYLTHSEFRDEHPGADEIIATYETDWRKVAAQLTAPLPDGISVYYQKHMTHHMLDHIELDWMLSIANCFLIREPRAVLLSFAKVVPNPHIDQLGLRQQLRIFNFVRDHTGQIPPVIDARDVLINPRATLRRLCEVVGIPFHEEMLSWRAGARSTDGIWAKYWYASVEQSTGFGEYQPSREAIPDHLQDMLTEGNAIYSEMAQYRLMRGIID